MNDKNVKVSTANLKEVEIAMLDKIKEFKQTLNDYSILMDDSKKIFDTPSAQKLRVKSENFIGEQLAYIDGDVNKVIEELEDYIKEYDELFGNDNSSTNL